MFRYLDEKWPELGYDSLYIHINMTQPYSQYILIFRLLWSEEADESHKTNMLNNLHAKHLFMLSSVYIFFKFSFRYVWLPWETKSGFFTDNHGDASARCSSKETAGTRLKVWTFPITVLPVLRGQHRFWDQVCAWNNDEKWSAYSYSTDGVHLGMKSCISVEFENYYSWLQI